MRSCLWILNRSVAQLVEQRSPKPQVVGSSPSWPAIQNQVLLIYNPKIKKMNAQAEDASNVLDVVKQVFSLVLVVAGVTAFYYFSDVAGFTTLYRVLMLVAIIVAAIGLMLTTSRGKGIWAFALESKQEVRKVVWPTREETMRTTLLVFGLVFLVGLMLWLLDMSLFWAIKSLTGQEGS